MTRVGDPGAHLAPSRRGRGSVPARGIRSLRATELLDEYLEAWGYVVVEGSASVRQLDYLSGVVERTSATVVGEIGFNAGHSSCAFLASSPKVQVVSFDLGAHPYIGRAKQFLDQRYGGRHTLIVGDSRDTVPVHTRTGGERFDLVFIDGGHELDLARKDLANTRDAAMPGAVVIMDDVTPWWPWGVGPTEAWCDAVAAGHVRQEELLADGDRVDEVDRFAQRAWAMGRFISDDRTDE